MNEEIDRNPADEEGRGAGMDLEPCGGSPEPQPVSTLSWRLVAWGGLVSLLAVAASELTSLWWLVLIFGLLVPAASALQAF